MNNEPSTNKDTIIIHTSARYKWEYNKDQTVFKKFLTDYWGVLPADLLKFDIDMKPAEAIKLLWSLKTKWKNAWKNVGYASLIIDNGEVVKLAKYSETTNGAKGWNTRSIHICWDGGIKFDYQTERFIEVYNATKMQEASMLHEIFNASDWVRSKGGVIKLITGHGQLEGVNKACPLFDAKEKFSWITA